MRRDKLNNRPYKTTILSILCYYYIIGYYIMEDYVVRQDYVSILYYYYYCYRGHNFKILKINSLWHPYIKVGRIYVFIFIAPVFGYFVNHLIIRRINMDYKETCDGCGVVSDELITLGDVIALCPDCAPSNVVNDDEDYSY